MEYIYKDNNIILKDLQNFDPEHILECGQAFRWNKEIDNSYTLVAFNRVINISKDENNIIIKNSNINDFENIWRNYFDLNTDYESIQSTFNDDEIMNEAISYGSGIRILNQEPFETVISFIISANNRIPQIKKSIELLCKTYGESIGFYEGKEYFSFPTPNQLSKAEVLEVREICRVGFRDKRIVAVSQLVDEGVYNLESLRSYSREEIRNTLIDLPGVGPKIADCITLFAFNKKDSFPVDVWIKRVMEYLYFKEEVNKNKVGELGREKFGQYAGVAQQYLFYYGRENSIGKI